MWLEDLIECEVTYSKGMKCYLTREVIKDGRVILGAGGETKDLALIRHSVIKHMYKTGIRDRKEIYNAS